MAICFCTSTSPTPAVAGRLLTAHDCLSELVRVVAGPSGTVAPSRVKTRSPTPNPVTGLLKAIVTGDGITGLGSGSTFPTRAVKIAVSTTQVPDASTARRLPARSWTPDPDALSVRI